MSFNLENKLVRGVAMGVLGVVSTLGGCSMGYKDGREKVDCSALVVPFAGGGMEIKHEVYKTEEQKQIECAFDSKVAGSLLLGGNFEMKISEENRNFVWMYRLEDAGEKDGKREYKLMVWDSAKKQSDWIYVIPDFLPSSVDVQMSGSSMSDLSGTTTYKNLEGRAVNPGYLLSKEAREFVKETIKK